MVIKNGTPFSPLLFENQDPDGDDFHIFVLKGTFDVVHGQALRPSLDQAPLVLADEYRGDPLRTSVQAESDLAPVKPNAEATIIATAHSPLGKPASHWIVQASVGAVSKDLRVTGQRFWQHSRLKGWHLSAPELCTQVPLTYELAYGGQYEDDDDVVRYEQNPAGVGFYDVDRLDRNERYPAPQIEDPQRPIADITERYAPQGFGSIARHWTPRRNLCGTPDDRWLNTRWPMLPEDFDFAYYNGAPPELVFPGYFRGGEQIHLQGLRPEGDLSFRLPEYHVDLYVEDQDEFKIQVAMNLDTLAVNVPEGKAHLVWRGTFLKMAPLARAETRMSGPGVISHA